MLPSDADAQGFALDAAVIAARGSRRQPAPVSKSRKNLNRGETHGRAGKARFRLKAKYGAETKLNAEIEGEWRPTRADHRFDPAMFTLGSNC
jgi:hypothetical protein